MVGFGRIAKVFLVLSLVVLVQCQDSPARTIPQILQDILGALSRVENRLNLPLRIVPEINTRRAERVLRLASQDPVGKPNGEDLDDNYGGIIERQASPPKEPKPARRYSDERRYPISRKSRQALVLANGKNDDSRRSKLAASVQSPNQVVDADVQARIAELIQPPSTPPENVQPNGENLPSLQIQYPDADPQQPAQGPETNPVVQISSPPNPEGLQKALGPLPTQQSAAGPATRRQEPSENDSAQANQQNIQRALDQQPPTSQVMRRQEALPDKAPVSRKGLDQPPPSNQVMRRQETQTDKAPISRKGLDQPPPINQVTRRQEKLTDKTLISRKASPPAEGPSGSPAARRQEAPISDSPPIDPRKALPPVPAEGPSGSPAARRQEAAISESPPIDPRKALPPVPAEGPVGSPAARRQEAAISDSPPIDPRKALPPVPAEGPAGSPAARRQEAVVSDSPTTDPQNIPQEPQVPQQVRPTVEARKSQQSPEPEGQPINVAGGVKNVSFRRSVPPPGPITDDLPTALKQRKLQAARRRIQFPPEPEEEDKQ